jgi:non-ribosomal peptide synthetase component E (peptide arylation enzyme)
LGVEHGALVVQRAFLAAHIAAFKIPVRFWEEHEALPRLGTEKVDKRTLNF